MRIVVGATCASWKCDGTEYAWLAQADDMHQWAQAHGHELLWFLALETYPSGNVTFEAHNLVGRVQDIGGKTWTFHVNDGQDTVTSGNRFIRIATGRNLVVEYATREKADWILYLDTDTEPPPDTLRRLLEVGWPIVGGEVPTYCVDDATEALTRRGWVSHADVRPDDEFLTLDPGTRTLAWQRPSALNAFWWSGDLVRWDQRGIDSLTTPDHRWLTESGFRSTEQLSTAGYAAVVVGGGLPMCFADTPAFSDEFVELVGWAVTEGFYRDRKHDYSVLITQSEVANLAYVERLRALVKHFADQGAGAREVGRRTDGIVRFWFGRGIGRLIRAVSPDKQLTPEFLCSLTEHQGRLLWQTLFDADGCRTGTDAFVQKDRRLIDSAQMLGAMLGRRTRVRAHSTEGCTVMRVLSEPRADHVHQHRISARREPYEGVVWCPTVAAGTWVARRNGVTFVTGNCCAGERIVSRMQAITGFHGSAAGDMLRVAHGLPDDPDGRQVLDGRYGEMLAFPVERRQLQTAGFLLVHRELFRRVRWRWDPDAGMTDDPCYEDDCRRLGFHTLVRTDVVATHHPQSIGPVESRPGDKALR